MPFGIRQVRQALLGSGKFDFGAAGGIRNGACGLHCKHNGAPQYALVIMDYHPPTMNSFECTAKILQHSYE